MQPQKEQREGDKTKAGTKTLYEHAVEKELFCGAFACLAVPKGRKKFEKKQERNRKEGTSGLSYCVVPLGAPSWSSGPFPPGFSWAPPVFYSDYTFQQIGWWRVASNVDAIVGQEIDDSAFITI